MPVILAPDAYDAWLDPTARHADTLLPLLVPCPSEWLEAYAVSSVVNSADRDEPACIVPATPAADNSSSGRLF